MNEQLFCFVSTMPRGTSLLSGASFNMPDINFDTDFELSEIRTTGTQDFALSFSLNNQKFSNAAINPALISSGANALKLFNINPLFRRGDQLKLAITNNTAGTTSTSFEVQLWGKRK